MGSSLAAVGAVSVGTGGLVLRVIHLLQKLAAISIETFGWG
jgi:hypothetical protein